jgi:general L-amino acid transport system permease protein
VKRQLFYQILLLAVIALAGYFVFATTQANLERLGVDSGFGFLAKRAGFEISQSLIPYDANATFARAFVVALMNTLLLAFSSIVVASLLGLLVGVSRLSRNWLVARLAAAYIEVFRNLPALLQIFFWYFVVLRALPRSQESLSLMDAVFFNNRGLFLPAPAIEQGGGWLLAALAAAIAGVAWLRRRAVRRQHDTGERPFVWLPAVAILIALPALAILSGATAIAWDVPTAGRFSYEGGVVLIPEFLALVVGLSMYNATYIGEIVRSGFQSIPRGQLEAADSLGLPRRLSLWLVLFPQALRSIIPPLTTVYLNLFKSTSLAAAIAYPEVVSVFVGTVNNLVGQPVVIMAMTLVVYAFVSLCIALLMNWYNRRIALTVAA